MHMHIRKNKITTREGSQVLSSDKIPSISLELVIFNPGTLKSNFCFHEKLYFSTFYEILPSGFSFLTGLTLELKKNERRKLQFVIFKAVLNDPLKQKS